MIKKIKYICVYFQNNIYSNNSVYLYIGLFTNLIQLNIIPEDGIIRRNILSSAVVYFSDTLPNNSPILIIIYHLELTPESYKFNT